MKTGEIGIEDVHTNRSSVARSRWRIFEYEGIKQRRRTDAIVADHEELEEELLVTELRQQDVRISPWFPTVHFPLGCSLLPAVTLIEIYN